EHPGYRCVVREVPERRRRQIQEAPAQGGRTILQQGCKRSSADGRRSSGKVIRRRIGGPHAPARISASIGVHISVSITISISISITVSGSRSRNPYSADHPPHRWTASTRRLSD